MKRPREGDYSPSYARYIEQVDDDFVAAMARAEEVTSHLLSSIPEAKGDYRYAEGKWSVKELLGHVIDSERIFAFRALSIARGESQSLPGYEQDDYVIAGNFGRRTLADLRREYRAVRQASLALYESIDPEHLDLQGVANQAPMTPRAIGFIIVGHELHHRGVLQERYLAS